jgi:hypothetical protein
MKEAEQGSSECEPSFAHHYNRIALSFVMYLNQNHHVMKPSLQYEQSRSIVAIIGA